MLLSLLLLYAQQSTVSPGLFIPLLSSTARPPRKGREYTRIFYDLKHGWVGLLQMGRQQLHGRFLISTGRPME